jgi:hypothetical protein
MRAFYRGPSVYTRAEARPEAEKEALKTVKEVTELTFKGFA